MVTSCSRRRAPRLWREAGIVLGLLASLLAGPAAQSQQQVEPAPDHAPVQPAPEPRLALVIGNSAYRDAPLANPVNDAQDMAVALAGLGFRVIIRENADRRTLRAVIREFGDLLKESGGVGLFYFAGHGMQVKGRNYLIPVGEDIHAEDEVDDQSVSIDLVLDKMETAKNPVNIVILDACRNNPFQRRFRSASRGLAPLDAVRGSFVAFATAPGSVAADGTGRNGIYTKHLLDNLRHADSSIESVFKRVRVGVLGDTGNRQVPWDSSSLTGDFFFNPLQRGQPAGSALTPARPPQDTPLAVEIAYWQSIQTSANPGDFEAYLKRYPQGQFTDLARGRIDAQRNRPQLAGAAAGIAAPVARNVARVHFFRERAFIGSALNYRIEHNGRAIGNLGNGAFFSYDSPPGQQSFEPVGNFGRGGMFNLEAGKTYHMELRVVPFSASFELVGSERGEEAVRSLR
jgi:hypothetical protein